MSHHFCRTIFSQTFVMDRSCVLPQIGKENAKSKGATLARRPPLRKPLQRRLSSTGMPSLRRRGEMKWECKYCPKSKKSAGNCAFGGGADALSADWATAAKQASKEEEACRRIVVANEAIERQRLLRLMQGVFPDAGISFVENEERGVRLLTAKDYAGAYVCFGRVLQRNNQSKFPYCKRALCDWYLMLYDECVEDCRKSLDVNSELLTILCRSLLLRKRYEEAREWYVYGLQQLAPLESDPYNVKWRTECEAIPALQKFCFFVKNKKWEEALRLRDAAMPLIDATPLVLQEARALLHVNPQAARLRLMSYVPSIPRPMSINTDMSLEEKALWRLVEEHYLHASVLLAQASAYCGPDFLEFAAALVQTCLRTCPNFTPAIILGNYLVSLDEVLVRVSVLFAEERYKEVISLIDDGLRLDKSNRVICSTLHCMRAEAFAGLGRHSDVISECTAAIDMNRKCAKAFVLRAEAYRQTNQQAESAMDRLAAVRLDPELSHILRGDEENFLPHNAEPSGAPQHASSTRRQLPRWYDAFCTSSEIPSESKTARTNCADRPRNTLRQTPKETLYDVVGLLPGAAISDVRAQFKKLALLYHPDRLVNASAEAQQEGSERFALINKACEVLLDSKEKFFYDLSLGICGNVDS